MSLIATARALDDQTFLWRVRAATFNLAVSKYSSTNLNEKALAQAVLDAPMQQNRTMEALVANDPTVVGLVSVDGNNTVNTNAVTDAAINNAVATYWSPVATRMAEIKAGK